MTPEIVAKIIACEKPDALLPTMGGQTALNTALALADNGTLDAHGVALIGASREAIAVAEGPPVVSATRWKRSASNAR